MDQRRAEIEAKRARLEEMRRKRSERSERSERQATPRQWSSVAAVVAHAPRRVRYSRATQTNESSESSARERETQTQSAIQIESLSVTDAGVDTGATEADGDGASAAASAAGGDAAPAPEFTTSSHYDPTQLSKFLESAFKVYERAQSDLLVRYDRLPIAPAAPQLVERSASLEGPLATTALAWSPHHRELVACAYGSSNSILSPGGSCILLWSLEFDASPEYTLKAPTDLLKVQFSPTSPWIVYGAGYNGQLYIWDLRQGHEILASMRSPADGSGHLLPVCALETAPGINHDLLLSLSVDGVLCIWPNDRLVAPQQKISLVPNGGTTAVAATVLALWPGDHSTFIVGTLGGTIHRGRRIDSVGTKAGIADSAPYSGHTAPITALEFSPHRDDESSVFLSASLDWSVRIWTTASTSGATCQEIQLPDAVTAAAWDPHHSGCFACCYRNILEVWNLGRGTQEPVARYELADLATSIVWDPYQRGRLLCGSKNTTEVLVVAESVLES